MTSRIFRVPFYPILFSIFPALSLFSLNINELDISYLIQPLSISLFFLIILWTLLNFFFLNRSRSAIATTVISIFIFTYGQSYNLISSLFSPVSESQFLKAYLLLSFLLTMIIFYLIKRVDFRLPTITTISNILALSLLIPPVLNISLVHWERVNRLITTNNPSSASKSDNITNTPDIYYIVIDSYASNNSLKQFFQFDNSGFTNYLEKKGFYVADQSQSNYPQTVLSVPSALNMQYLDNLAKQIGLTSQDTLPLFEHGEKNRVVLYLKSRGYKFFNFGAGGYFTQKNRFADFNYSYDNNNLNISAITRLFLEQTLLNPLLSPLDCTVQSSFICIGSTNDRRDLYYYELAHLKQVPLVAKEQGPKFIFVHSLLVHGPFVMNEKCEYLPLLVEKSKPWRENYSNSITCTNQLLREIIDDIIENSINPPIIVIQSDEGTYPDRFRGTNINLGYIDATTDELKEKFGILNAYYLPNRDTEKLLYSSITPVNSFRIILNTYFGEDLPLLKDTSFAPIHKKYPYNLFDVTESLK